MIVVIVAAIVVVAAVVAIIVLAGRRRATPEGVRPTPVSAPPPMTGLETALEQATDRSGRPIREAIDAETGHVDDLRVPDDTGPLLRRVLDHVTPDEVGTADRPTDAGATPDPGDRPAET